MNRLDQEVCVVCGMPFTIERTDGVPMHGECEKRVRQNRGKGMRKKKHDGFLNLRTLRYVPPTN